MIVNTGMWAVRAVAIADSDSRHHRIVAADEKRLRPARGERLHRLNDAGGVLDVGLEQGEPEHTRRLRAPSA